MRYRVDTHLHIYPFHRAEAALAALIDNMPAANGDFTRMACLTERHDCFVFDRIAAGEDPAVAARFDVERRSGTVLQLVRREDGAGLYLVAGQQIVTSENIEVLALGMDRRVADGADAATTVRGVLDAGGTPVAAWGFGKWLGARARVIRDLLDRFGPGEIALGDTTMRPRGWATPYIMRAARRRGYRILAGSDPLPFAGEERRPGSYHSIIDGGELEPEELATRLLTVLPAAISSAGSRSAPLDLARRMLAHRRRGQ